MNRANRWGTSFFLSVLVPAAGVQAAVLEMLMPVSGTGSTHGLSINNAGDVAGLSAGGGALWKRGAGTYTSQALPSGLAGGQTQPGAVNDARLSVGYTSKDGKKHATFWNDAVAPTYSHTFVNPSNVTEAEARDVNNANLVVGGQLRNVAGVSTAAAMAWQWDGTAWQASDLPGGGSAYGVNDSGDIVGSTSQAPVFWRRDAGSGWTPEVMGVPSGFWFSRGEAVNDHGVAVGISTNAAGPSATKWQKDASGWNSTLLPTLPGTEQSWALDISSSGVTVGYLYGASISFRAVAWDADNNLIDLNPLLDAAGLGDDWSLELATSINDQNTIAGYGRYSGGDFTLTRGFVLTAPTWVPEPGGAAALLLAGGAILGRRRRPSARR